MVGPQKLLKALGVTASLHKLPLIIRKQVQHFIKCKHTTVRSGSKLCTVGVSGLILLARYEHIITNILIFTVTPHGLPLTPT